MFEDLWTEFWAIPANELFWCSLVAGAAFAADFTVRYILFPKVGMDRRWAYAFGVSSGLLAFRIMCEEGAVWMGVGSLFIFVPGIWIYDNRFDRSKQYRKERTVYSREAVLFAAPYFGFIASCIELFSFTEISKKFFFKGEVGGNYPSGTAAISFIVSLSMLIILDLIIRFG